MKHRISHKKYNGHRVYIKVYDPLNPLDLPPYTIRLKFVDDYTPVPWVGTCQQVSSSPNIWDMTFEYDRWDNYLGHNYSNSMIEVLGANTTNVTSMEGMFSIAATALSSVALFDTSNVTSMRNMFYNCTSLTSIPLFNTSKVKNVDYLFNGCKNVEFGALALYQQMSSQSTPPSAHTWTFKDCGINTQTGSAELEQIPYGWKS